MVKSAVRAPRSKGKGYWDRQLELALREPSNPLAGYFPFPVFGRYFNTLSDADATFDSRGRGDRVFQHCLAARLNVASGRLGWYTEIADKRGTRFFWEHWNDAFNAYQGGREHRAKEICESLNERGD